MTDLVKEADAILELLRTDLLASVGFVLDARVRLVSREEQQALDLKFDAMLSNPNTTKVFFGSGAPQIHAGPLDDYETCWAVEMPGTLSMIHDAVDVIDVVQEEVIKDLWTEGRAASWPECPEHGGHPLDAVLDRGRLMWRCPRDSAVTVPLGGLGQDGRFQSA